MNEPEITELLLRAILDQKEGRLRNLLIQNLLSKHSPSAISSSLTRLTIQGHATASLAKTLNLHLLH